MWTDRQEAQLLMGAGSGPVGWAQGSAACLTPLRLHEQNTQCCRWTTAGLAGTVLSASKVQSGPRAQRQVEAFSAGCRAGEGINPPLSPGTTLHLGSTEHSPCQSSCRQPVRAAEQVRGSQATTCQREAPRH